MRTDPEAGGTSALSAIIVERGTPGVTYKSISTSGQRLAPNCEIVFDNARVPAANLIEGTRGNGDLLINRNFAWSGRSPGSPRSGSPGGVRGGLEWSRTYTAGGPEPIINYQYPGYVLGDVAAKIEAARYFCWKGAHYLDQHDFHGELVGAMNKILCTELMMDCVYKCMQVVGVNSVDKKHMFERYLREASILPLYDAGNFGMQRRRVHGVMADPSFNPRALVDDEEVEFTKAMEGINTVPGPRRGDRQAVGVALHRVEHRLGRAAHGRGVAEVGGEHLRGRERTAGQLGRQRGLDVRSQAGERATEHDHRHVEHVEHRSQARPQCGGRPGGRGDRAAVALGERGDQGVQVGGARVGEQGRGARVALDATAAAAPTGGPGAVDDDVPELAGEAAGAAVQAAVEHDAAADADARGDVHEVRREVEVGQRAERRLVVDGDGQAQPGGERLARAGAVEPGEVGGAQHHTPPPTPAPRR